MNDTTFQGDGKVAYVPVVVNAKLAKPSRADRIRSMTDEELAGILAMQGVVSPPWCAENYDCPYADQDPVRCDLCALDWLREEAGQDAGDGP